MCACSPYTYPHFFRLPSKLNILYLTWILLQPIPVLWLTCPKPELQELIKFTNNPFIGQIFQELTTLYSLPEAKNSLLPYDDPSWVSHPPRLSTPGPGEGTYGDFCSKTKGLFIGLTHPFTELPQEITKSITGIQNQLSTKGQQSQE